MARRLTEFVPRWCAGLSVAVACGCAGTVAPDRRGPVIDMHLHAYPAGMSFAETPINPATGQPTRVATGAEQREATLAEMRRLNVVKGFVSAGDGPAETALVWVQAAPERIVAGYRFDGNAGAPLPRLKDFRRDLEQGRYGAVGEVGAQYAGLSLSDPRFEPYLALAEKLRVPVGVHTGLSFPGISYHPCCRSFRTTLGNPQTLEEVLNRHPQLRLYLMHGGYPYAQETIAMMYVYPQLYADLAVINWIIPREEFYRHLRVLVDAGLSDRLMYGSDQMRWPEMMGPAIASIEEAPFLSAGQKRGILCDNAARFLGLAGDKNPCSSE